VAVEVAQIQMVEELLVAEEQVVAVLVVLQIQTELLEL